MSTMNAPRPDTLKTFADKQIEQRGYGMSSEHMHGLLLAGAGSSPTAPVDAGYFDSLQARARNTTG